MTTKQIVTNRTEVTDPSEELGWPTNQTDKIFQIVVEVDDSLSKISGGDYDLAVAASLAADVQIEVSNDRVHWNVLYASKTVTKAGGDVSASDFWDPATNPAYMWSYHRAVVTAIDPGLKIGVWMSLASH
jgi:hypothetical protein